MKRPLIVFIFLLLAIMSACAKNENKQEEKTSETEENTTKTEKNTSKTEEHTTKEETMDKTEILNNGKLSSDKEVKSVAIRDGNTGKIIFEAEGSEDVKNIAEKLWQMEFVEYEDPQSVGWRYNLLINNDDMQLTISGNDLIRIRCGNKSICCRTDFDIIGYIENELLNAR